MTDLVLFPLLTAGFSWRSRDARHTLLVLIRNDHVSSSITPNLIGHNTIVTSSASSVLVVTHFNTGSYGTTIAYFDDSCLAKGVSFFPLPSSGGATHAGIW